MENLKSHQRLFNDMITQLYKESYEETVKKIHSGKNKYRLKNQIKEYMKTTSKILDKLKSDGISLDEILNQLQ